ncbi:MAG: TIGR03618 family F420-dependent PPOX class oxidoreductase [Streptosporangiaceae bacterium]
MLAVVVFAAGIVLSLAASQRLVSRLERIGAWLGLSEALLGMVAALAADAPEISAAVSAVAGHHQRVGAGVVLGSNVFNLAALLGLGAVVAGGIRLHRRVVLLGGTVAVWVAGVSVAVVTGLLPVTAGLALAVAVLALYLVLLGTEGRGIAARAMDAAGLAWRWQGWLRSAVTEEEIELDDAIRPSPGRWPDVAAAGAALVVVVAASVGMERAAVSLGDRYGVPEIVVGGLVLAAVTSMPNAVAAVYLAARGRGHATLSTALNSNTINVVVGLLIPGAVLGLGRPTGQAQLAAAWYAGLTLAILVLAWRHAGLSRGPAAVVIAAYAAFCGSLLASAYAVAATVLVPVLGTLAAVALVAGFRRARERGRGIDEHMTTTIPANFRDLLSAECATLATIGPDGRPQLTEVWFVEDGDSVALSLNASRQKTKNLLSRPQCTLFILDPAGPYRYLEVRGDAEISPDDDYEFAAKVGAKYKADLRVMDQPGQHRVVVRIKPVRVNAVNMRG